MSGTVDAARDLARRAHADHTRKAGGLPYFSHLESVAQIAAAHGYDDEVTQAAAYLHDLIEDRPAFEPELRAIMPQEVVDTVEVLTERKLDDHGAKRPKAERFRECFECLRSGSPAARRALPISCADKIHNTSTLVEAEGEGENLLMRLNTRPGEHRVQLCALRALYTGALTDSLLAAYDSATEQLLSLIDAWLPGRAVEIAAAAHLGSFDEAGEPSVFGPMRRALSLEDPQERIVVLLQGAFSSGKWSAAQLVREGFSPRVLRAVEALTRRRGEAHDAFIERIAADRLATRVKLGCLRLEAARSDGALAAGHAREARRRQAIARLSAALRARTLCLQLDDRSLLRARERARYEVPKASGVILARRIEPSELRCEAIPGGFSVGDEVDFRAISSHDNGAVQVWAVSIAGHTKRASDGGLLHLTVSCGSAAVCGDAEALLQQTDAQAIDLPLRGKIVWVDE